jgi:hypothetical protein
MGFPIGCLIDTGTNRVKCDGQWLQNGQSTFYRYTAHVTAEDITGGDSFAVFQLLLGKPV